MIYQTFVLTSKYEINNNFFLKKIYCRQCIIILYMLFMSQKYSTETNLIFYIVCYI